MNKRNKRNCTDEEEKKKKKKEKSTLRNKNIHNNIVLFSKLVALKTAACWIYAVSCSARHQAF